MYAVGRFLFWPGDRFLLRFTFTTHRVSQNYQAIVIHWLNSTKTCQIKQLTVYWRCPNRYRSNDKEIRKYPIHMNEFIRPIFTNKTITIFFSLLSLLASANCYIALYIQYTVFATSGARTYSHGNFHLNNSQNPSPNHLNT